MKKDINYNHSTKQLLKKSSSIVFFLFSGKCWVGERGETISLTYIALSRIRFKCIKIAVTKRYIINIETALKFVWINYMHLITGSHLSHRDKVCLKGCSVSGTIQQNNPGNLCNNPINLPCLGNDIIVKSSIRQATVLGINSGHWCQIFY